MIFKKIDCSFQSLLTWGDSVLVLIQKRKKRGIYLFSENQKGRTAVERLFFFIPSRVFIPFFVEYWKMAPFRQIVYVAFAIGGGKFFDLIVSDIM